MIKWLLLAYGLWNLVVFVAYAYDKWQAKRDGWRVPERNLLVMAVLLGGPGALLAILFLRHKSSPKKSYFRWAAYAGILVSLLAAYGLWQIL